MLCYALMPTASKPNKAESKIFSLLAKSVSECPWVILEERTLLSFKAISITVGRTMLSRLEDRNAYE
jgi:hypothetical protein